MLGPPLSAHTAMQGSSEFRIHQFPVKLDQTPLFAVDRKLQSVALESAFLHTLPFFLAPAVRRCPSSQAYVPGSRVPRTDMIVAPL